MIGNYYDRLSSYKCYHNSNSSMINLKNKWVKYYMYIYVALGESVQSLD